MMQNVTGEKKKSLILGAACVILLLMLDQLTKLWASQTLQANGPIELFPGVFEFHYLQNQESAVLNSCSCSRMNPVYLPSFLLRQLFFSLQ